VADQLAMELATDRQLRVVDRTQIDRLLQERRISDINGPILAYDALIGVTIERRVANPTIILRVVDLSLETVADWPHLASQACRLVAKQLGQVDAATIDKDVTETVLGKHYLRSSAGLHEFDANGNLTRNWWNRQSFSAGARDTGRRVRDSIAAPGGLPTGFRRGYTGLDRELLAQSDDTLPADFDLVDHLTHAVEIADRFLRHGFQVEARQVSAKD
jgi:hypothetical protein